MKNPDVASDDEDNDDAVATDDDDDLTPGDIKLTITGSAAGANSYRVDVSDDVGKTWTTVHRATLPISTTEYEHENVTPEKRLHFRLFGKRGSTYGLASNVVRDYAGNTDMPSKVEDLVAVKDGAGKINVSWSAPDDDGGADVEQYCILVNKVDDADAVLPSTTAAKTRGSIVTDLVREDALDSSCTRLGEPDLSPISVSGTNKVFQVDAGTEMVTFKGLEQETRWQFEVYALNKASDMNPNNDESDGTLFPEEGDTEEDRGRHAVSATSDIARAKTDEAAVPGAPQRLTAQLAQDTNEVGGVGSQGVLVLWNPPANPAGAPVKAYKIERSIDGGEYTVRVASHGAGVTHWADPQEPPEGEVWTYRITAINDVGSGTEMATVTIPYPAAGHTHPPAGTALTAPSDVMATFAVTDPGDITVTWTPGENATEGHLVLLFNSDFTEVPHVGIPTEEGMYTIPDVTTAGDYVVVVVSVKSRSDYLYDYARVNVP